VTRLEQVDGRADAAGARSQQPHPVLLTAEELRSVDDDGYVVLDGILTDAVCDLLSATTDEVWRREQIGAPAADLQGVQFCANLLRHSAIYDRCVNDARVLAAVAAFLGAQFRLDRIISRRADPQYGHQPLHDLERRRGRPFFKANAIWCLDEFTATNGATRVLPGSHLSNEPYLSRMVDPDAPHPDERVVVAPRGSVIVHSSHLIHGGTRNRTDRPRRSIHSAFTTPEVDVYTDWTSVPQQVRGQLSTTTRLLMGLST